jgi:hypothetical protein
MRGDRTVAGTLSRGVAALDPWLTSANPSGSGGRPYTVFVLPKGPGIGNSDRVRPPYWTRQGSFHTVQRLRSSSTLSGAKGAPPRPNHGWGRRNMRRTLPPPRLSDSPPWWLSAHIRSRHNGGAAQNQRNSRCNARDGNSRAAGGFAAPLPPFFRSLCNAPMKANPDLRILALTPALSTGGD